MIFILPMLNYDYDALEPYIDEETMRIHHTKHHKAYTDNFNASIKDVKVLENLSAIEIIKNLNTIVPEDIRAAVKNHGGGYVNHNLFWQILGNRNNEISREIKTAIEKEFGDYETFKAQFEAAAKSQFGSGWAFLVVDENKKLKIVKKSNQDSPLTDGHTPILALDVWEHAYYLKYQNRRPEYITNFWKVVDWKQVNNNYINAL